MLGDPDPILEVRRRVIPLAQGEVLEIGTGTGASFVHYDPVRVHKLYALEPNPGMIRLAERRRWRTGLDIEFLDLPGERIPLMDGTIDTIVSTFTLCTIPSVAEAVGGMRRVVRPGGKLIFFELTRSLDPAVRRWQRWWEPMQQRVYASLYLTRDIPALLTKGGFQVEQMDTAYLSCFPKSWTHCCWGTAIPQPHER
jgi:ubiquinone/menaquinone biosynthesis C-methylase UbiE